MKKSIVACLILALALVASPATADGPGRAVGGVKFTSATGNDVQIELNAIDPLDPKGRVKVRVPARNVDFVGDVTCLQITGSLAIVSGVIERGTTDSGPYYRLTVQDNGEGANALPDMVTIQRSGHAQLAGCRTPGSPPTRPVEQGNTQVMS